MNFLLSNHTEVSTHKVIAWLHSLGKSYKRFNEKDFINDISISLNNNTERIKFSNSQVYNLTFINSFWYRKGDFKIKMPFSSKIKNAIALGEKLGNEWNIINYFLHHQFNNEQKKIGSLLREEHNNKLIDLVIAKKNGLFIPSSLVTTKKKELITFFNNHPKMITKPLKSAISIKIEESIFNSGGSKIVTDDNLAALAENFFPIFVQEYMEKEIELRIFHLHERNYSMAIFSQLDEQTKVDYRNYNRIKPNRNVPFKLPDQIEYKINAFMKESNLDTGSIDMILTPNGEYIFLEVNPVGQFDWLSTNCNYFIEQKIANFFADE